MAVCLEHLKVADVLCKLFRMFGNVFGMVRGLLWSGQEESNYDLGIITTVSPIAILVSL